MINHFKNILKIVVFIGFGVVHAGSYEDFFIAVKRDDVAAVDALLARGFDPNTRDPNGLSGLYLALRDGGLRVAKALIAWPKTQVEVRTAQDESPLMMAALKGQTAMVQALIDRDADVNKTGWAPLHYAATNGHLDIMRLLLDKHAYIDAASPNGTTPLMMAAHYGSPGAVKVLLEAGADPLLKNELGLSAIDFAQKANRQDAAELIAAFVRAKQPKGTW